MPQTTLLFIGGIGPVEIIFLLLFIAAPLVLWLWALIDLLRGNFSDSTTKLIWAVVIIFIPILGSLLYLLIGRNQKVKPVN
ncbi:PLD nuclease N-terminal domain-containing protein [Pontibacter pudoricolor]|uniref:PLD nuclease N-terminal domain-containing protein n=1 Tax=Pontibacter pudoricolor TaxID=2694930 RepID=UPI0013909A07|nr:PLD nuclease N-terminal domain-containing protein [Pontibacter pudoricolor]